MGSPRKEVDIKKVEVLAAQGMTAGEIAQALGMSERTFHTRKAESKAVADAVKCGQAKGIAVVTNKLMEQVKRGNVTAMIFYLKARAGWREKQEIVGDGGGPLQLVLKGSDIHG